MKRFHSFFNRFRRHSHVYHGIAFYSSLTIALIGLFFFVFWGTLALRAWLENYIADRVVYHLSIALPEASSTLIEAQKNETVTIPLLGGLLRRTGSSTSPVAQNPTVLGFNNSPGVLAPVVNVTPVPQQTGNGSAPVAQQSENKIVSDVLIDLFSGNGWIDASTTMYQDLMETAFLLPPKVRVERSAYSPSAVFISRNSDGSDTRCVSHRCLTQKGTVLSLDGRPVQLPEEVRSLEVQSVSIGNLNSKWVVGVVTKNGEDRSGWLFVYDGANFKNIQKEGKEVFLSRYDGTIGFGGTDNDWMAVYGAYEGKAVRVQASAITDISGYFGIRVMSGGFDPEVTRVASGGDVTWFVWNKSGFPKLIKLFQNGTDTIAGATDLSTQIQTLVPGATSVLFAPASSHELYMKASDGGVEYWKFIDDGFDNSIARTIISTSLSNRIFPVRSAIIPRVEYVNGGGDVIFALSNSGKDWSDVAIGQKISFTGSGYKAFWRASVKPSSNRFYSPYFSLIEVNYEFEKQ